MKYNSAFFKEELLELKMLTNNDDDIEMLSETVNKYPVDYEIVRNMIICGLSVDKIREFCDICYNNGLIIEDSWFWYRRFLICGLINTW